MKPSLFLALPLLTLSVFMLSIGLIGLFDAKQLVELGFTLNPIYQITLLTCGLFATIIASKLVDKAWR